MVKPATGAALCLLLGGCSSYITGATGDDSSEYGALAECEGTDPWDPEGERLEAEVMARIDAERRRGGQCGEWTFPPRAPLGHEPRLRCAARRHSLDMATREYVGFIDPDGVNLGHQLDAAGYEASVWVASASAGWTDPDDLVDSLLQNPVHCYKLFAAELESIGVGVYLADLPDPTGTTGGAADDTTTADGIPDYASFWTLFIAAP